MKARGSAPGPGAGGCGVAVFVRVPWFGPAPLFAVAGRCGLRGASTHEGDWVCLDVGGYCCLPCRAPVTAPCLCPLFGPSMLLGEGAGRASVRRNAETCRFVTWMENP